MKRTKKLFGIIALTAVIGFTLALTACDDGGGGGGGGNKTPKAADYTIGNMIQSANSVTAVTVTKNSGASPGEVSNIRYDGSATIPQAVGNYAVIFDVAAATGWDAATGLSAGTLEVNNKQTPKTEHYTFGNLTQTVGNVTAVTIAKKGTASPGDVSNIRYAGSTTLPTTAGTYAVTFDVAAAEGWNAATNLSAGNLVISSGGSEVPGAMLWTALNYTVLGTSNIQGVTYGGGKWVAFGGKSDIAYSADGITWTSVINSLFGQSIRGVIYGGGKWVAFGVDYFGPGITYGRNKSIIAYSDDGVSWTAVADTTFNATHSNEIIGVAYGGGKWVAFGYTRANQYQTEAMMAYSDDGITWTVANSTFGDYQSDISGVTYDGGKWVAVGKDYDSDTYSNYCKIAYSSDGVTWTAVEDSAFNAADDRIDTVVYGGGKWFAVGRGYSDPKIAYSSDGVTWTAVSNSAFASGRIRGVTYGGGKWVAVNNDDDMYGKITYSSDGITWTAVANTTFGYSSIDGVAYGGASGNMKFVAFGRGKMAYSADGVTWTAEANTTFGNSGINGVAYGGGKWLAFGESGKMAYSVDE